MSTTKQTPQPSDHELVLTRLVKAPRHSLFRAWTEPELLKQWFAPHPCTVPVAETDVRPGGTSLIVMRVPDGKEMPCHGVYLEVVKDERLVFTDAYTKAWYPSAKPFMTVIITFEDEADGRLTSRRSQPPLALAVPLSRFTPRVGGGSAFFVRRQISTTPNNQ
jgi:uncharacterized protein YndB with AHSA1/START domain